MRRVTPVSLTILVTILLGVAGCRLWGPTDLDDDGRWALDWTVAGPCADGVGLCTARFATTGGDGGRLIVDDRAVATGIDLDAATMAAAARAVFEAEPATVCPDSDLTLTYDAWRYPPGDGTGDAAMVVFEACVLDPALERALDRFHRDTGVDPYDPATRTPGDR